MPLKILDMDTKSAQDLPYLNAGRKGVQAGLLPVLFARASGLPAALDALVITSDLQFVERRARDAPRRLMGEALPDLLEGGILSRFSSVGVILAGDLFALPDLEDRGGIGDVGAVWSALAARSRWVAGVLGNHDALQAAPARCHLLDGTACELDGLRIGGVSGILQRGESPRQNEKSKDAFAHQLESALVADLDLLVLHHDPALAGKRGSDEIARAIEDAVEALGLREQDRLPLVVCGHRHWEEPVATMECGAQVLNVDKRVVILRR